MTPPLIGSPLFETSIVYSTYILGSNKNNKFDTTYKVSLKDKKYGEVKIENIGDGYYSIHANLKKEGKTELILESPKGKKEVYNLIIKRDTYRINKKKSVDKGQEKWYNKFREEEKWKKQ